VLNLQKIKECLVRSRVPLETHQTGTLDGISGSYCYFGKRGCMFVCHLEDVYLESLSVLLWGAPKVWIGVEPRDHEKLE
jgi:hypothetical protein